MLAGVLLVLAIDLGSKLLVLADDARAATVIYNPDKTSQPLRIVLIVIVIATVAALTWAARWRGIGPVPILWLACGGLIGGVSAQGISLLVWERGVPDFIYAGDHVWNLADFAIGQSLLLTAVSLVGYSVRAALRGTQRH